MAKTPIDLNNLTSDPDKVQSEGAPQMEPTQISQDELEDFRAFKAAGGKVSQPAAMPQRDLTNILWVTDTTAIAGELARVHEMMIGGKRKSYSFSFGNRLEMSRVEGMQFSKTEGFIVEDADGNRIKPMPLQPFQTGINRVELALNQCVANLDELTDEALLIRCQQSPGGDVITQDNSRTQRIDFLEATRRKYEESLRVARQRPTNGDGIQSDGEFEGGMDRGTLDRMLLGLGREVGQIRH